MHVWIMNRSHHFPKVGDIGTTAHLACWQALKLLLKHLAKSLLEHYIMLLQSNLTLLTHSLLLWRAAISPNLLVFLSTLALVRNG